MSEEFLSPEDLKTLNEINELRGKLIKKLVGEDASIPSENSDKNLLVSLMHGIDSSVLAKAKLKAAQKNEESFSNMASVIARALANHRPGQTEFDGERIIDIPSDVPPVETVPGEMDIGMINLTKADLKIEDDD